MTTTEAINESLAPLFERAEKEGLWFYTAYQGMWFSPKELKAAQEKGTYLWGSKLAT